MNSSTNKRLIFDRVLILITRSNIINMWLKKLLSENIAFSFFFFFCDEFHTPIYGIIMKI